MRRRYYRKPTVSLSIAALGLIEICVFFAAVLSPGAVRFTSDGGLAFYFGNISLPTLVIFLVVAFIMIALEYEI